MPRRHVRMGKERCARQDKTDAGHIDRSKVTVSASACVRAGVHVCVCVCCTRATSLLSPPHPTKTISLSRSPSASPPAAFSPLSSVSVVSDGIYAHALRTCACASLARSLCVCVWWWWWRLLTARLILPLTLHQIVPVSCHLRFSPMRGSLRGAPPPFPGVGHARPTLRSPRLEDACSSTSIAGRYTYYATPVTLTAHTRARKHEIVASHTHGIPLLVHVFSFPSLLSSLFLC